MFNDQVYELTRLIPKGKVTTYGEIAKKLGNKNYARAVGNALHNNPYPIVVPCHRVVNSQGNLAKNFGSHGKIKTQEKLLKSEGIEIINYKVDLERYLYIFE